MSVKITNNAYSSLSESIITGDTTLNVVSTTLFPTLKAIVVGEDPDVCYVTIDTEVIKVTDIVDATSMTCEAVVYGHSIGSEINVRATEETLNGLVSGLIIASGTGTTGWNLKGENATYHSDLGEGSIDLTVQGAGIGGASGTGSIAIGKNAIASGGTSVAIGEGTKAINTNSMAIGKFNNGSSANTKLEIGIGATDGDRKNGLEVYIDGTLKAPESTISGIDTAGAKAIVTKEKLDEQIAANIISIDTTVYISSTSATPAGNDTTGEGTILLPFLSLLRVAEHLKDKWINTDVELTVLCKFGVYYDQDPVVFNHPCSDRIKISGVLGAEPWFSFTTDGITVNSAGMSIENILIKGDGVLSNLNTGLVVSDNAFCKLTNVEIDGFDIGLSLTNCVVESSGLIVLDTTSGVSADNSSGELTNCNIRLSTSGILATNGSNLGVSGSDIIGCTNGFYAIRNSFINASNTTSTSTLTYSPDINTEGNIRSYIYK